MAGWGGQEGSRGRTHRPWRHAPRPTTRGRPPPPEPPPSRTGARSKSWLFSAGPAARPTLPSFCAPHEGIQERWGYRDGDFHRVFFSLSLGLTAPQKCGGGPFRCCSQTPGPGPWGGWVWAPNFGVQKSRSSSSPQEVEGPGPVEGSSGQPPLRSQHRVRTPETRGQPGPRAPPGDFNFPGPGSGREIQSESEGMQPGAPSDPLFIRSSLAQPKP